eukprot:2415935-Ditylum_brightwellii.AAC.1
MKAKIQSQINQLQFTTDEQCHAVLSTYLIKMSVSFNKVDCDQFKAYTKACCSNNKVKHTG